MKDMLFQMIITLMVLFGSGYVIVDKNQSDQVKTLAFGAVMGVFGYFVPSPTSKIGEQLREGAKNKEPKDNNDEPEGIGK